MIDHGETDDKIIAVLANDHVWENVKDVSDVPAVKRVYACEYALKVVKVAIDDYDEVLGK